MNNSKNTLNSQYPQPRAAFSGSTEPYLTIINKSTSTPVKNGYIRDPELIKILSDNLRNEFLNDSNALFNEKVRRGLVKMKRINANEFSVYRVSNRSGCASPRFKNIGLASHSDNARFYARNRLIETIKANEDFRYFFTGTFDPKRWNRKNFSLLQKSLTRFLRSRHIKYILIPEPHKDGCIHFHGLFDSSIEPYLAEFNRKAKLPQRIIDGIEEDREIFNFPDYAKFYGWVSIERIKNLSAVANYVSKYVSKCFDNENSRFSYRRYFCSLGLKHPEFVLKTENSYSEFDYSLSTYIPKVSFIRRPVEQGTPSLSCEAPRCLNPPIFKSRSAQPTIRD